MEKIISYAITVCNEIEEIKRLLTFLQKHKRPEDEICVLLDKPKAPSHMLDLLYWHSSRDLIKLKESAFQGHFADWKNELNRICSGDIVINIDPDEIPSVYFINNIPSILENNNIDVIWVPRINTIDNIGLSHVKHKWGWNVSKFDNMVEEKEFDLNIPQDLDEYSLLKEYNLIIEETSVE